MQNEQDTQTEYAPDDGRLAGLPWWRRPRLAGLDAVWLTGITLVLVFAAVFLSQRHTGPRAADDADFSEMSLAESVPVSPPADTPTPGVTPDERDTLATDLKAELDSRDKTQRDRLAMMQDSLTHLAEAIRRDEAYSQETRKQLDAMQATLSGLQTKAVTTTRAPSAKTAKKKVSAVSGMQVVSLESGMAWVRWQGSTWAVRQGDTLGKVTINVIDPGTRTLHTSGGDVR